MTFDSVEKLGNWMPIRDCPGRFVLHGVSPTLDVEDLLGEKVGARQFTSPKARDEVWVVCFEDGGGIISYRRPDGAWIHTLNTREGFKRKLEQLEIKVEERAM